MSLGCLLMRGKREDLGMYILMYRDKPLSSFIGRMSESMISFLVLENNTTSTVAFLGCKFSYIFLSLVQYLSASKQCIMQAFGS